MSPSGALYTVTHPDMRERLVTPAALKSPVHSLTFAAVYAITKETGAGWYVAAARRMTGSVGAPAVRKLIAGPFSKRDEARVAANEFRYDSCTTHSDCAENKALGDACFAARWDAWMAEHRETGGEAP